ncbi:peroxidase family protein [Sphingomonas dokdonensis]|uniref:Catalase-peroxidase 2 n=1 Tax=Sphingomonas dokdonensis TaxID=344880 RepID=A0A245ZMM0_9SPHN|nr:peroxidase family protein [Sphingomonas dokdonensis]OWK30987.1 catalase-peroxidase 2 [Sphingomonas dokdonensis]
MLQVDPSRREAEVLVFRRRADDLLWQDPIPSVDHPLIEDADIATLKRKVLESGLSESDLAFTAFPAASTFRTTDKRGGANGAWPALAPQKDWAIIRRTVPVVARLREVMAESDAGAARGKRVSLADLIVLGSCAAIEQAAADAEEELAVPFGPGLMDTDMARTDADSFEWLRPVVDSFRNYVDDAFETITPG